MKLTTLAIGKLRFILTGLLLATIACAGIAISANGLSTACTSQVYAAPHGVQDEVLIQLSGNGFVPAEVQHAAGTFAILVENSNVSGEYTLTRLPPGDGGLHPEGHPDDGPAMEDCVGRRYYQAKGLKPVLKGN